MQLKYVAETYQILQLGVSLVVFDKRLKVYPYNFYLFPRTPTVYDRNINMQLGCLKFNADNGMDWNKWIRQGVNYIQLAEKSEIERAHEKQLPVQDTLNALTHENQIVAHRFLELVQKVSRGELPSPQSYEIHRFNSMQRQLVSIFHRFIKEEGLDVSVEEKEDSLVVRTVSRERRSELEERKKDEVFGFSLVF
jgi:poly(A)-specific ribonuclease